MTSRASTRPDEVEKQSHYSWQSLVHTHGQCMVSGTYFITGLVNGQRLMAPKLVPPLITWNISPAPSQSEEDMSGVWMRWKPHDWKKLWVAAASALLILITAPIVLVLGRRCAMPRRNSSVCRFFCSGYVAGSHWPNNLRDCACTSTYKCLDGLSHAGGTLC